MALTKAEARLETLRLAIRPGLDLSSILETAEAYYEHVVKEDEPTPAEEPKPAKAKVAK